MLGFLFSVIMLLSLALSPLAASALPSCVDLGSDLAFDLAGDPQLSAVSSALVSAAGGNAASCQVNMTVASQCGVDFGYLPGQCEHIRVRVGLPLSLVDGGTGGVHGACNGKQRDLGGGGYAGIVGAVTSATNGGYVGTSTDTGHDATVTPGGSFALNKDHTLNWGLIKDFAVDGIHAQRAWGHDIATIYYGTGPTRHYWTGCSTGGRQGHQQAQTFPKDYDGILAGAPAFNWDRFIPSELWPQIVMFGELGGPIAPARL